MAKEDKRNDHDFIRINLERIVDEWRKKKDLQV